MPEVPGHARHDPVAPTRLSEDEAQLWGEIVAALPSDWFNEGNLALLETYCHSIVVLRMLDGASRAAMAKLKEPGVEVWDELALIERCRTLAAAETRTAANLATKMRLTQQARISNEKGGAAGGGAKPWEA